jgi:hypothetical protein
MEGERDGESGFSFPPSLRLSLSLSLIPLRSLPPAVSPMIRVVVAVVIMMGMGMVGLVMVVEIEHEIMAATQHDEQHKAQ